MTKRCATASATAPQSASAALSAAAVMTHGTHACARPPRAPLLTAVRRAPTPQGPRRPRACVTGHAACHAACAVQYVWRLAEIVDKQAGGVKTVLKEKVWLGTYHTPINAAVHHDFYKVVLAVEGCIFTSVDVPTCSAPTGKKKSQKLKLNFPLNDLPELMYKAVRFTQLWNKYKQDAERYVFRSFDAAAVRALVQELIDKHCLELRKHVANNDPVRPPSHSACPVCSLSDLPPTRSHPWSPGPFSVISEPLRSCGSCHAAAPVTLRLHDTAAPVTPRPFHASRAVTSARLGQCQRGVRALERPRRVRRCGCLSGAQCAGACDGPQMHGMRRPRLKGVRMQEGTANTVERRSTRTRATIGSQRSVEMSGDIALE